MFPGPGNLANLQVTIHLNGVPAVNLGLASVRAQLQSVNQTAAATFGPQGGWGMMNNHLLTAPVRLTGVRRQFNELLDPIRNLNVALSSAAGSMALLGTAGGTAVGVKLVQTGIEVERAWMDARKDIEGTVENFDLLKEDLRQIGKEMGATDFTSIIGAAAEVAKAGVKAREEIAAVTEEAVKFSLTSDTTAEKAAANTAQVLQFFNRPMTEAKNYLSTVTVLARETTRTESEIMNLTRRLAPIGGLLGMSPEQVTALAAATLDSGQTVEVAGTALTKFFVRAVAGQEGFSDWMGKTADEMEEMAKTNPFQLIEESMKHIHAMPAPERAKFLEQMSKSMRSGGVGMITTILGLVGNLEKANKLLAQGEQAYKDGSANQKEFAVQSQTTSNNISKLQTELTLLSETFYEGLSPAINEAIDAFRSFVDETNEGLSAESIEAYIEGWKLYIEQVRQGGREMYEAVRPMLELLAQVRDFYFGDMIKKSGVAAVYRQLDAYEVGIQRRDNTVVESMEQFRNAETKQGAQDSIYEAEKASQSKITSLENQAAAIDAVTPDVLDKVRELSTRIAEVERKRTEVLSQKSVDKAWVEGLDNQLAELKAERDPYTELLNRRGEIETRITNERRRLSELRKLKELPVDSVNRPREADRIRLNLTEEQMQQRERDERLQQADQASAPDIKRLREIEEQHAKNLAMYESDMASLGDRRQKYEAENYGSKYYEVLGLSKYEQDSAEGRAIAMAFKNLEDALKKRVELELESVELAKQGKFDQDRRNEYERLRLKIEEDIVKYRKYSMEVAGLKGLADYSINEKDGSVMFAGVDAEGNSRVGHPSGAKPEEVQKFVADFPKQVLLLIENKAREKAEAEALEKVPEPAKPELPAEAAEVRQRIEQRRKAAIEAGTMKAEQPLLPHAGYGEIEGEKILSTPIIFDRKGPEELPELTTESLHPEENIYRVQADIAKKRLLDMVNYLFSIQKTIKQNEVRLRAAQKEGDAEIVEQIEGVIKEQNELLAEKQKMLEEFMGGKKLAARLETVRGEIYEFYDEQNNKLYRYISENYSPSRTDLNKLSDPENIFDESHYRKFEERYEEGEGSGPGLKASNKVKPKPKPKDQASNFSESAINALAMAAENEQRIVAKYQELDGQLAAVTAKLATVQASLMKGSRARAMAAGVA